MKLSSLPLWSLIGLAVASPAPVATLGERELVRKQTPLNAFLTVLLDYLPDVNGAISDVVDILTGFETILAEVTGLDTTEDDLGSACTEYTLVFARGTTEPGNLGILVGPPLQLALEALVGADALTVQGVNNYGATIDGYIEGGEPAAGEEMAKQIQQAYDSCPDTKLITSGYSQGGQIVHNSADLLSDEVAAWISSAVIFGDPYNGKSVGAVPAEKTLVFCAGDDNICVNGILIFPAHLLYGQNVEEAANFIVG